MILKRFKLLAYTIVNEEPVDHYEVAVPDGSRLVKITPMNDGIYLWYEVPDMEINSSIIDVFKVVTTDSAIPLGYEFIDIVIATLDSNQGQIMLLFPIYNFVKKITPLF